MRDLSIGQFRQLSPPRRLCGRTAGFPWESTEICTSLMFWLTTLPLTTAVMPVSHTRTSFSRRGQWLLKWLQVSIYSWWCLGFFFYFFCLYFDVHYTERFLVSSPSSARTVAEAAPTWLSPTGSSSSILVLQGEELLLECIAAGVWVWTLNLYYLFILIAVVNILKQIDMYQYVFF